MQPTAQKSPLQQLTDLLGSPGRVHHTKSRRRSGQSTAPISLPQHWIDVRKRRAGYAAESDARQLAKATAQFHSKVNVNTPERERVCNHSRPVSSLTVLVSLLGAE